MRAFPIAEQTAVMEARREGAAQGKVLGFSEEDCGRIAIIVTELGTNLVKHASGGEILVGASDTTADPCLDILALDRGPGLDMNQSMVDGFSTAGTQGTGLGAIRRQATTFGLFTAPGRGTAIHVRVCAGRQAYQPRDHTAWGAVTRTLPGEEVCGDAVAVRDEGGTFAALVADGLGHGAFAADAATTAVDVFGRSQSPDAENLVTAIHAGLKASRGAAIAVASCDSTRHVATYCGIGNIGGALCADGTIKRLTSQNGTAGLVAKRVKGFHYPYADDTLLVMHSDGLSSSWNLMDYPGLIQHEPMLIAAVLYRDFGRSRDDASVLVARVKS